MKNSNEPTRDAETEGTAPVPLHLRNAPTRLMKDLGYGKEYKYPHDFADGFVPENYFPETLGRRKYYEPSGAGHEKVIADRLNRRLLLIVTQAGMMLLAFALAALVQTGELIA